MNTIITDEEEYQAMRARMRKAISETMIANERAFEAKLAAYFFTEALHDSLIEEDEVTA